MPTSEYFVSAVINLPGFRTPCATVLVASCSTETLMPPVASPLELVAVTYESALEVTLVLPQMSLSVPVIMFVKALRALCSSLKEDFIVLNALFWFSSSVFLFSSGVIVLACFAATSC